MQRNPRLPQILQNLSLPLVGAPMYIASNPALVTAQCKQGIVGSFPALNARPKEDLDKWLTQIKHDLQKYKQEQQQQQGQEVIIGPIAVNHIVNKANDRLDHDLAVCVDHKVPIFITSLQAPPKKVVDAIHSYGGVIFHDCISVRHAKKALEANVDGLIAVAAGAGGHTGNINPFSLVSELRLLLPNGPILLSGCMSTGRHILAAQACGADLAYMGTRFLATNEANVRQEYKQCIVDSTMSDVIESKWITGVKGTFLSGSFRQAGLDPENLPGANKEESRSGGKNAEQGLSGFSKEIKPWRDIWAAGHGCGDVKDILPAEEVIKRLKVEYREARREFFSGGE
jgi:nitronate monooxygenase